ncbi:DUF2721 domain-containing protein [Luteimonas sp. M1R5S18]|jgi:hypothetical protein|uniref:DUF2721 domain-containing protein n=1 Tax=Luteimonas rhizosphaericola TaxID=3042024 RepID=A0ABT6JH09_9GAMM|nr:DUF2721 domain-containing protein [Luteimonas rhizosphaericola]MDH5829723.1 DUF2721 domain-containing protein [Luteimonas rhizosphaericola]
MPPNATLAHYAILTAMLAPAFFLTATAALLGSANARLARIIDRARSLLKDLAESEDPEERSLLERRIAVQRRRSLIILRASQLLYVAISCFVATSLLVAGDSFFDHVFGPWPTIMAVLGVLAMFGSSLLLASEASMAVRAVNDEMDDAHRFANRRSPLL